MTFISQSHLYVFAVLTRLLPVNYIISAIIGIEFLVTRDNCDMSNSTAISAALKAYGNIVHARGKASFVALSRRTVVLHQLHNFGVDKTTAASLLVKFENDVVESRQDVEYVADTHTLDLFQQSAKSTKVTTNTDAQKANSEDLQTLPDTCRTVLFNLQVNGVRFHHHGLTYDARNLLRVRSLVLFDKDRVPLLSIAKDLSDRLEHFPHLGRETHTADDIGIDTRSPGIHHRNSVRRRESMTSQQRRDSTASVNSRYSDPSPNRRAPHTRRRRQSGMRDSPPDPRLSRNASQDSLDQVDTTDRQLQAPTYLESFRIERYASLCSIVLKYEEKDVSEGFGQGGWDVGTLYKPFDSTLYGVRDGFVSLAARQLEVQFSTNSILQIIEQAVAAASVVRSHYIEDNSPSAMDIAAEHARRSSLASRRHSNAVNHERRRRSTVPYMGLFREKSTLNSSINNHLVKVYVHQYQRRLALKGDIAALTVVLSWEQHFLAQLSLYRVSCAVQDLTNLEGSRACTASVHSLSLLDLSELGALHGEVLWKHNDNLSLDAVMESIKAAEKESMASAVNSNNNDYLFRESSRRQNELFKQEKARIDDAPAVISLSFTQSETSVSLKKCQKLLVNVEVDSLRVCVLYRFIMEMLGYFTDKLVVPLHACLSSLEESARRISVVPTPLKFARIDSSDESESAEEDTSDLDFSSGSDDDSNSQSWSGESVSDAGEGSTLRFSRRRMEGALPMPQPDEVNIDDGPKFEMFTHFECLVSFTNVAATVPRNSNSRDLIGIKIGNGTMKMGMVAETFPMPGRDEAFPGLNPVESDADSPLHFDVATNAWRYKPSLASVKAKPRFAAQSNLDTNLRRSFVFDAASRSAIGRGRARSQSAASLNSTSGNNTVSMSIGIDDDGDVFYDATADGSPVDVPENNEWSADFDRSALRDWGDNSVGGGRWRTSLTSGNVGGGVGGESTWWLHDDEDERERLFLQEELAGSEPADYFGPKDCHRIAIDAADIRVYVTFAGPAQGTHKEPAKATFTTPTHRRSFEHKRSNTDAPLYTGLASASGGVGLNSKHRKHSVVSVDTTEHKIFVEIQHGGLVNKFRRKATGSAGSWPVNQAWREVTLEPFNLLMVVDNSSEKMKMLFGDTAVMSHLKLHVAQSELYLLMGLWFDNMFEQPQFGLTATAESASADEVPDAPAATPDVHDTDRESFRDSIPRTDKDQNRDSTQMHKEKEPVRFNLQQPAPELHSPGRGHTNSGASMLSDHTGSTPRAKLKHSVPLHFARYGSREYIQYLRERLSTFEIVFLRAEVHIKCSIDTNYFPRDIPNQDALVGMEASDNGSAFCHHYHHHHHVHRTPHNGASASKLSKSTADESSRNLASASKGARLTSEDKMNSSFYNLSSDAHTPSGKKVHYSRWVNKLLNLADVNLSGVLVHIQCDHDVTQLSLSAGKCEVYDVRSPQQICAPLALRVAPAEDPTTHDHAQVSGRQPGLATPGRGAAPPRVSRRVYGYSDFTFGFDLLPSDMITPPDVPLKICMLMSEITNWNTVNVGMDLLDLNIHNLDLAMLLGDYFSCYFRFPEYGHPGVQAYDRLTAPYIIPYGGVDTRVFAFRPHISLLKAALNPQSPALLLETEGGIYYRYTLDTESTVKMELNIFSLAVILVKRYRPPSQYRGIRGSSGSGKGVRTLIEHLNVALSYHFIVESNNLDVKVYVSGPEPENDDDSVVNDAAGTSTAANAAATAAAVDVANSIVAYVDLHAEALRLGGSAIPHPHSVFPLAATRTDFTPDSCDIVASYEDLTFCISLVNKFLNVAEPAASTPEEPKPHKKDAKDQDRSQEKSPDKSDLHREHSHNENTRPRARTLSKDTSISDLEDSVTPPCAIFSVLSVTGVRLMVVDNVLGLHLPLVQVFVEEVQSTLVRDDHANMTLTCATKEAESYSTGNNAAGSDSRRTRRFSRDNTRRESLFRRDSLTVELVRLKSIAQYQLGMYGVPAYTNGINNVAKQELMTFGKCTLWAEYFNNMRKCWEPLLEKTVATVLYEKSVLRGTGLTFRTASAVHANISGAFFRTLNDILTTLRTTQQNRDDNDREAGGLDVPNPNPGNQEPHKPKMVKRGSIHMLDPTEHDYQYDDHHQHELGRGLVTQVSGYMDNNRRIQSSANIQNSSTHGGGVGNRLSTDKRTWSQRRKSRFSEGNRRSSINNEVDDGSVATPTPRRLDHVPSNPLSSTFRVGFSIQNLTGQPVRYLQQWEGGRRTVQYINNNERGLLNFVASKTLIRNNQVIEETFDVQMELSGENVGSRNRRKAVGNRVALQVSGYRWLHAVQADELGVHYEELYSVLGRVHASTVYKNWKIVNSLKLMVEVMPYCGGRMLRLRSVFTIKNNTRHRLKILCKEGTSTLGSSSVGMTDTPTEDAPFLLESGENFYVPLALLRRSVLASAGKSLGYLYLCPADIQAIEEELVSRPNSQPGSVEYTTDPINLYQTVVKSSENAAREEQEARRMAQDSDLEYAAYKHTYEKDNFTQLVCHINPKLKSRYNRKVNEEWNNNDYQRQQEQRRTAARAALNKLPPFCYCVEVHSGTDFASSQKVSTQNSISSRFFSNVMHPSTQNNSPVNFTISK